MSGSTEREGVLSMNNLTERIEDFEGEDCERFGTSGGAVLTVGIFLRLFFWLLLRPT